MSQTEIYSAEEKQMELDDDDISTKHNDNERTLPKPMCVTLENLSNDLRFLCGTNSIPIKILSQLQAANITTFEEILLIKIKDINPDSIDIYQLTELQQNIASNHYTSIQIKPLSVIIEENKTQIKYHSTAIPALDNLISENNAGISSKSITSFVGAASSGKTLMLYQIAAVCALNGGRVIFIDCHNQFDGQRFFETLKSIQLQTRSDSHSNDNALQSIMKQVIVYSVCSLMETMDLMQNDRFISLLSGNVEMIIIDNMDLNTYLYELNTTFLCHAQICKLSRKLKYFALKYNLSVITSSLSLSNITQHNYWIRSSYACMFKNWYHYIDNEVHLLLTTHFGAVKPLVTKSRKHMTCKKDSELVLCIKEHILATAFNAL